MHDNLAISDTASGPNAVATMQAAVSPINLWVVDDNRRMRDTMMELFERCDNIRCTAAFHSPNAVLSALASRVGPDVILLDLNLGDHSGIDAIRPIKSLSRSTHVLMFTTFFDPVCKERALTSGATDFLLKSFPLDKITDAIRSAWNKPVPHLKAKLRKPVPATPQLDPDASPSQSTGNDPAVPARSPRSRLAWVKNCLDVIRASRN